MKTVKLQKKVDRLNRAASKLTDDLLIPSAWVFFTDSDGSIDDSDALARIASGEKIFLNMDIEEWPEHTRPMTDFGRGEMAKEAAARDRLVALAVRLGFKVEVSGDGSGSNGPITCYSLSF